MELSNKVCSLDLSRRLKELGVKQESLFYWLQYQGGDSELIYRPEQDEFTKAICFSAFTVAELGDMLPAEIDGKRLQLDKLPLGEWFVSYVSYRDGDDSEIVQTGKTESEGRAKMLIYLLENKLITL